MIHLFDFWKRKRVELISKRLRQIENSILRFFISRVFYLNMTKKTVAFLSCSTLILWGEKLVFMPWSPILILNHYYQHYENSLLIVLNDTANLFDNGSIQCNWFFVILLINLRINIDPIHTNFYMYNKSSFSYYSEKIRTIKKATKIQSSESFCSFTVLLKLRFLTTSTIRSAALYDIKTGITISCFIILGLRHYGLNCILLCWKFLKLFFAQMQIKSFNTFFLILIVSGMI